MADEQATNRYIEEYYNNEYDANRYMALANLFSAFTMIVIWLLYIFNIFLVHENTFLLINIVFPIDIVILVAPLFFIKTKYIRTKWFKYFVLFSFVMVISLINIIIPKHGILGWALCIVMANHYYNQKLGKLVYATILVSMFVCLYAGMFIGEYDPHTLGNGIVVDGQIVYPDSSIDRYNMLHDMIAQGENRYLKVFIFYYLPRTAFLTLIFLVSNFLNKRTYNLLVKEIQVNSEQEKVNTELNVARDIQISTLPSTFTTTKEVEIMAELKAAKEVGGDFYDYFELDDEHVAVLIGDVSGKGIPAAMFMMKTITCFKNFTKADKMPSEILKEVNKTIFEGNEAQMFVTCFLAIINTKTGLMRFANAGHNPPIIGKNFNYRYLKCNTGFILGGMPDAFVSDEQLTLEKGESLTLYTDGVTEARNKSGAFYGEEQLLSFFNARDYTCLVELHHNLKDDIARFVDGADQSDDITFLTIKYHGDAYVYEEKLFPAKKENIVEMLNFIEDFCHKYNFDKRFINNLSVVGDELFSNIANYAYVNSEESDPDIFIRVLLNKDKNEFVLTVIDRGMPFNQLEVNNNPLHGNVEEAKIGGLGILIVKQIMTQYAYDRINNKNILNLRKKL